jgi:hypothetical protein
MDCAADLEPVDSSLPVVVVVPHQTKASWQNHIVDLDMANKPFQPCKVPLDEPQVQTEGPWSSVSAVKGSVSEFRKLPLKV